MAERVTPRKGGRDRPEAGRQIPDRADGPRRGRAVRPYWIRTQVCDLQIRPPATQPDRLIRSPETLALPV